MKRLTGKGVQASLALIKENEDLKKKAAVLEKRIEMLSGMVHTNYKKPVIKHRKYSSTAFRVVDLSDMHGNHMDARAVGAFLHDLKSLGLGKDDHIVYGGDMVDCGGFLAQHHTLGHVAAIGQTSYKKDCEAAAWFLTEASKLIGGATEHYLEGNHEQRPERWAVEQSLRHGDDAELLVNRIGVEAMLNVRDRGIKYYKQVEKHCGLEFPGVISIGKCHYVHGNNTSRHAAHDYASRYGANIVYHHTHRADYWESKSLPVSSYCAINPGCMCEQFPAWQHGRPSEWSHGYLLQLFDVEGNFMNIRVPIINGRSYLSDLLSARK